VIFLSIRGRLFQKIPFRFYLLQRDLAGRCAALATNEPGILQATGT